MKTIEDGHIYDLSQRGSNELQRVTFINTEKGHEHPGVTTQEVIRALIDRTQYCDACLPWSGNNDIVGHLRMALALHEARAVITRTERGELLPERVSTRPDGHFILPGDFAAGPVYAFDKRPQPTTQTGSLKPGEPCHTKP